MKQKFKIKDDHKHVELITQNNYRKCSNRSTWAFGFVVEILSLISTPSKGALNSKLFGQSAIDSKLESTKKHELQHC